MNQQERNQNELFDFEKLIVYQRTLEFRRLINPITLNPPRKSADLVDHLAAS